MGSQDATRKPAIEVRIHCGATHSQSTWRWYRLCARTESRTTFTSSSNPFVRVLLMIYLHRKYTAPNPRKKDINLVGLRSRRDDGCYPDMRSMFSGQQLEYRIRSK